MVTQRQSYPHQRWVSSEGSPQPGHGTAGSPVGGYAQQDVVNAPTIGGRNGIPTVEDLRGNPNEDTAIWIHELRRRMGVTQKELAEQLGYADGGAIGNWERATSRPPQSMTDGPLSVLAEQYGMVPPPEGGPEWKPRGARFASGVEQRYAELFGPR